MDLLRLANSLPLENSTDILKRVVRGDIKVYVAKTGLPDYYRLCFDNKQNQTEEVVLLTTGILISSNFHSKALDLQ